MEHMKWLDTGMHSLLWYHKDDSSEFCFLSSYDTAKVLHIKDLYLEHVMETSTQIIN